MSKPARKKTSRKKNGSATPPQQEAQSTPTVPPFLEQVRALELLLSRDRNYQGASIAAEAYNRLVGLMTLLGEIQRVDKDRIKKLLDDDDSLLDRLLEETDEEMLTRIVAAYVASFQPEPKQKEPGAQPTSVKAE